MYLETYTCEEITKFPALQSTSTSMHSSKQHASRHCQHIHFANAIILIEIN